MIEDINIGDIYTLTDDDDGVESEYEVLGTYQDPDTGKEYLALIPNDEEAEEYIILRCEGGETADDVAFVTVDDDDEFDKIADYFEDALFSEIDCDAVLGDSEG